MGAQAAHRVLHDERDRHVLRLVRHRHARAVAHAAAGQRRERGRQVRRALLPLFRVQVVPLLVQKVVKCDHGVHEREALFQDAVDELAEREGLCVRGKVRDRRAAHEARRIGRRQRRRNRELAIRVGLRLHVRCTMIAPCKVLKLPCLSHALETQFHAFRPTHARYRSEARTPVRNDERSAALQPFKSLVASRTMYPATIALVVAIAWMMLPALPLAANSLRRGMP